MNPELILGLGSLVVGLGGVLYTYLASKGKTKTDAKTAMDQRLDEKMAAYTEKVEERLEDAEAEAAEAKKDAKALAARVEMLEIDRTLSDRRELLLYRHTKALRDHIINEKPPPPPTAPSELIDWFENFEDTHPS